MYISENPELNNQLNNKLIIDITDLSIIKNKKLMLGELSNKIFIFKALDKIENKNLVEVPEKIYLLSIHKTYLIGIEDIKP